MERAPVTDHPAWHARALAARPRRHEVRAGDVTIRVRTWGDTDRPPVVLIHGGAAHGGWWDHIGPLLAQRHHVLAPDLSGHGDSDWRSRYSLTGWSREVAAVIAKLTRTPPVVVGHSLGGHVGLRLALDDVTPLGGLVLVDSPFRSAGSRPDRSVPAPRKTYPTREATIARFRTLPSDTPKDSYIVDHVAAESVIAVPDGWSWKFDPGFFDHDLLALEDVEPVGRFPVLVVRGEHGMVDEEMAGAVCAALGQDRPPVTIGASGHHVPLDQPLALVATVSRAAGAWLLLDPSTAIHSLNGES